MPRTIVVCIVQYVLFSRVAVPHIVLPSYYSTSNCAPSINSLVFCCDLVLTLGFC